MEHMLSDWNAPRALVVIDGIGPIARIGGDADPFHGMISHVGLLT